MRTGESTRPHASTRRALLYGAGAALAGAYLALVWCWAPAYLALTFDDSFYYLQIARNVARGLGPSFDGVEPTNGFHPLWLAAFAGLARVGPTDVAPLMRVALSVQIALVTFGTWALTRAPWARSGSVVAAALLVFAHSDAARVVVNGQESALHYALLASLVAFGAGERAWSSDRRAAAAGLWMGLALLNRSDALLALAAWVAPALAWPAASLPARSDGVPSTAANALPAPSARAIVRARRLAIGLALALAPLSLYALWSAARFGHAASVSGAVKYAGLLYPPYAQRWWLPLLTAAALTLGARALGRRRGSDPLRADAYWSLALLVSYAALQWALTYAARGEWVPDPWYLVPALVGLVVVLSLVLGREAGPGRAAAPLAALGLALALAGWARRLDPGAYALADAYRRAALWLRASPAGADRAAGWDCGVAGAHFDGRLSNLDGLVASWAYQENYLEPGRVGAFLDDAGVGAIVQHFARSELDPTGSFVGVDLAGWRVAHAECVTLRLATRPWRREHRFVAVLVRGEAARGPRFDEAARGWRALERCPLP